MAEAKPDSEEGDVLECFSLFSALSMINIDANTRFLNGFFFICLGCF